MGFSFCRFLFLPYPSLEIPFSRNHEELHCYWCFSSKKHPRQMTEKVLLRKLHKRIKDSLFYQLWSHSNEILITCFDCFLVFLHLVKFLNKYHKTAPDLMWEGIRCLEPILIWWDKAMTMTTLVYIVIHLHMPGWIVSHYPSFCFWVIDVQYLHQYWKYGSMEENLGFSSHI